MEIKGWEHSCKDLAQLDRDRIQINYMDNLTYVFMNRETCLDFKKDLVTLR
jgi:translation elongation factor P/translation initiation factor 5A